MINDRRIGVIGLGLMGTAISERLLENGYHVRVWNRTREKAEPLIQQGALWSDRPGQDCNRLIISLYDSDVVAEVLGEMRSDFRPGQYIVDTTTGSPDRSIEQQRMLRTIGVAYLDAPISGSSEQTRRGEATVIVGGEKDAFDACSDLWPMLGKSVFHVGPCGTAAKMKLISNLVLGLNRLALAEGLAFAEGLEIEPAVALEVLKGSAAYSRTMDNKGPKMVNADYSVQAKLSQHLKDVRLMLKAAHAAGIQLPMTETHRQLLETGVAEGLGELDNSAIYQVLQKPIPA